MSTAAAARAPDAFDRLGEQIADRVNPIVVKEVRQGLRTRVFWIFFTLMLVACLFISLVAFASTDGLATDTGRFTFIAYFVALGFVQFFVIPYVAYRSMAREAEDETWVLLTLTGIGPRKILAGKLSSSVLQGSLYASAATPFLLFSYFLNGIDLPTIVMGVAVATGYQVFLVSVSVSLATLAESRIVRGLLHFLLLGILVQGLGMGIAGAVGLGEIARKASGSVAFWLTSTAVLYGMVTTGLILFEAAAARLSLPTEDYARGPRLAYLSQVVGMCGLFAWGYFSSGEEGVLVAASVTLAIYSVAVGLFVASDRDGMAKVHWATGGRFSLLKPGGLRGYVFVMLLLLIPALGVFGLALGEGSMPPGSFAVMVAAPAFSVLLLSLSVVAARGIPHPPWQTPAMVRLVCLGLVVLMTGVPPLIGEIVSEADDVVLNAFNPVVGLVNIDKQGADAGPLVMLVWAVALGLLTMAFASLRGRDTEWLA